MPQEAWSPKRENSTNTSRKGYWKEDGGKTSPGRSRREP